MTNPFKKAERKRSHLNVALTGPSGSGKTWSALAIATGMGGRIAVADTENGSASLYAKDFEFDALNIHPPFTQQKYINAVKSAVEHGYDILIIDSLSHVWAGEGGVQDQKDALDERGGSRYANWKQPKALHKKVKDAILHSPIHIIATIRSKQGYVQSEDGGKSKVIKVGMDPIAEPGIEYEFTVVFDMDMAHHAQASKDRTKLYADGKLFKPSAATGVELMAWRNEGGEPDPEEPKRRDSEPLPQKKQESKAPPAKEQPQSETPKGRETVSSDPGDYVIEGGNKYKGRTIRQVIDEVGLPKFQEDLHWLTEKSDARNATWVKFLKVNAERFFAQIAQNHADASERAPSTDWQNEDFDTAYDHAAKAAR